MKVKTNMLSDQIEARLNLLYGRVYRNRPLTAAATPYVVFMLASTNYNPPSLDYYLHVDVFDKPNTPVRDIEDIADSIVADLDCLIIRTDEMNAQLDLEQRQFVSQTDLTVSQMINLRFNVRTYFFDGV